MSVDLDRLVAQAKRHAPALTGQQRKKMKRAVIAAGALGAGGASALSLAKVLVVGTVAAVVGGGATAGAVHVLRARASERATVTASARPTREAVAVVATREAERLPASTETIAAPRVAVVSPPRASVPRASPRATVEPVAGPTLSPSAPTLETPPVPKVAKVPADPEPLSVPAVGGAPTAQESTLSVELALVREATDAIDARDDARAAVALDRYDARIHGGALSTEAGVLRVVLDCATGRGERALASAKRLVALDRDNPALGRLRGSCAGAALTP